MSDSSVGSNSAANGKAPAKYATAHRVAVTCIVAAVVATVLAIGISLAIILPIIYFGTPSKASAEACIPVSLPDVPLVSLTLPASGYTPYAAQWAIHGGTPIASPTLFVVINGTVYIGYSNGSVLSASAVTNVNEIGFGKFNFAVSGSGERMVYQSELFPFNYYGTVLTGVTWTPHLLESIISDVILREGVSISVDGSVIAVSGVSRVGGGSIDVSDHLVFVEFYTFSSGTWIQFNLPAVIPIENSSDLSILSVALNETGDCCVVGYKYLANETDWVSKISLIRRWASSWQVVQNAKDLPISDCKSRVNSSLVRNVGVNTGNQSIQMSFFISVLKDGTSGSVAVYEIEESGNGFSQPVLLSSSLGGSNQDYGTDFSVAGINCPNYLFIGAPNSDTVETFGYNANDNMWYLLEEFFTPTSPHVSTPVLGFGRNVSCTRNGNILLSIGQLEDSSPSQFFTSRWIPSTLPI